jgi:hypothetical protein
MSNTAFFNKIVFQELFHEKKALESSKDALEQYELGISICDEILFDIEDIINMKDDLDRQAIFAILIRVIGTMQSIRCLFLKGYYYDGFVLQRSLFESLGDCCYISQHNGTGKKWFEDGIKFKLCNSLDKFQAINKTVQAKVTEEETTIFYRKLCKFVHGNRWAVASLITEIIPEDDQEDGFKTIHFNNPLPYDKWWVDTVATLPLITLLIIQQVFPELSDYAKKQIMELQVNQYALIQKLNANCPKVKS